MKNTETQLTGAVRAKYLLPTILELDALKWRCGGVRDCDSRLGEGNTCLLNTEEYMCCLGQFSLQAGVSKSDLWGVMYPAGLSFIVPELNEKYEDSDLKRDTLFASRCALINDDRNSVYEKIYALRAELKKHGKLLIVRNLRKAIDAHKARQSMGSDLF